MIEDAATIATSEHSSAKVRLLVPGRWNGRLVGIGGKGACGRIEEDEMRVCASRGYAVCATDSGTARALAGEEFCREELLRDYGHRSVHAMTLWAKERIRKHTGKAPRTSLFVGSSTGGQQGFALAQRYPGDYDGILAGVPAIARTALHLYFLWNRRHLYGGSGKFILSKEQERAYRKTALEVVSGNDPFPGARGKYPSTIFRSEEETERILGLLERREGFPREALDALSAVFSGPVCGREHIHPGIPPGADLRSAAKNMFLFDWIFGNRSGYANCSFAEVAEKSRAVAREDVDALNDDLLPFMERGGKILSYAGTLDSCVPAIPVARYFESVASRIGPLEKTLGFFRLYVLPGRSHLGGPGVQELSNPLETLRIWVEKGRIGQVAGRRLDGSTVSLEPHIPRVQS